MPAERARGQPHANDADRDQVRCRSCRGRHKRRAAAAPPKRTVRRRRRQAQQAGTRRLCALANRCRGEMPCRGATSATTAPGAYDSGTSRPSPRHSDGCGVPRRPGYPPVLRLGDVNHGSTKYLNRTGETARIVPVRSLRTKWRAEQRFAERLRSLIFSRPHSTR